MKIINKIASLFRDKELERKIAARHRYSVLLKKKMLKDSYRALRTGVQL